MDQGLIPRRYAKALYEVGEERNDNDALYAAMGRLAKAFADTPGSPARWQTPLSLRTTRQVCSPLPPTGPTTKISTLSSTISSNFSNATSVSTSPARLPSLSWPSTAKHSIFRVDIVSAATMADKERARLEKIIESHIGKGTFEYDYTVNPALIGGFMVTVNSERLDASVSSQLENLRLKLID